MLTKIKDVLMAGLKALLKAMLSRTVILAVLAAMAGAAGITMNPDMQAKLEAVLPAPAADAE